MVTRYPDAPPGAEDVGQAFERAICKRLYLEYIEDKERQIVHGDGKSPYADIYHEIKHDPHSQYGHLMIEVAERTSKDGPWILSGIFASSDAHYYDQGDEQWCWQFAKEDLVAWAASKGITPAAVWLFIHSDFPQQKAMPLKTYNDTMIRLPMEYSEAEELGWRFSFREDIQ